MMPLGRRAGPATHLASRQNLPFNTEGRIISSIHSRANLATHAPSLLGTSKARASTRTRPSLSR
eukprot:7774244-Pyramimonas_sp.AAC.1